MGPSNEVKPISLRELNIAAAFRASFSESEDIVKKECIPRDLP